MRLDIHVYHHVEIAGLDVGISSVLGAIANLKEDQMTVNAKLLAASAAAAAMLQPITDKLNALETFVNDGVPKLVAAGVADALAQTDLDEGQIADVISGVLATIQKEVDDVILPAAEANTGGGDTAPAGGGEDTVTG
jgi:intracellular sulfur oxidation DsrE/DsrF family protein